MAAHSKEPDWQRMHQFRPKLVDCATCDGKFYRKPHTRRKYCDACKARQEEEKNVARKMRRDNHKETLP